MDTRPNSPSAIVRAGSEPRSPVPVARALSTVSEPGKADLLAVWCQWCEDVHTHGALGGGGNRAPHCAQDRHSPLISTGYDLKIAGEATSVTDVQPVGLLVGIGRLHEVMSEASVALRTVLLRYVLGLKSAQRDVLCKRTPRGNAWIFGLHKWLIEEKGWQPVEGSGFLRLAATLYGVPPGVVAVRFLEAVSCDRLDAAAALEVQHAIDAWVARGAQQRPAR